MKDIEEEKLSELIHNATLGLLKSKYDEFTGRLKDGHVMIYGNGVGIARAPAFAEVWRKFNDLRTGKNIKVQQITHEKAPKGAE